MSQENKRVATSSLRLAKKAMVAVVGVGVLGLGVLLIILPFPGPAVVLIPCGLVILAMEFHWARKLLHPIRELLRWPKVFVQKMFGRLFKK